MEQKLSLKAIIGLGNPGPERYRNRHSIGFRVVDALAQRCGATWALKDEMAVATAAIAGVSILLVKPHTFMNASGNVIPALRKKGIQPGELLVVHDELELPFGKIACRLGGSARGHNGLRSLMAACGPDFWRLRVGIGRPDDRQEVSSYVLADFTQPAAEVDAVIEQAVEQIEHLAQG